MIHRPPPLFALLVLGLLGSAWLAGCREPRAADHPPERRPVVVVGIDGGEWKVIRDLWGQGKLPHLNALAQRGVTTYLRTDYGLSPVIWTTIATGMKPEEHGIFDFVVPTARGDVQVSSTVRRVPAIWNMLSRAERRVAVLGWLISWPAEEVNGVVVSSRALLKVRRRVFPEDFLPRVEAAVREGPPNPFVAADNREPDYTMARLGRRLVAEGYDLLLVYLRGVDTVCHQYWKEYRPQDFPAAPPSAADVARYGDRIPREYEAVDWAIGHILAAARPEPNVLVISDHGFGPAETEIVRVVLNFDRVLERLGYQARKRDGMDWDRTQLYCHASPAYRATKWVRFALAGL